jgi:hypothetical protein
MTRKLFPIVVALAVSFAAPAFASHCRNTGSYDKWLEAFKKDAVAQGISPRAIAEASPSMTFDPAIIKRDHGQGVFSQTFLQFSDRMTGGNRIPNGRAVIKQHADLFARVEKQYGVPAPVLAAFWVWKATSAPASANTRSSAPMRHWPMTAGGRTSSAPSCSILCASSSVAINALTICSVTGPASSAACSSLHPTISRTRSTSTATAAAI